MNDGIVFEGELFEWAGEGAWHFVRMPVDAAEEIRDRQFGPPRGFGSIRVTARVGATSWQTSVFPEKESGSYLLPVKKLVRLAEDILAGDQIRVELSLEAGPGGAL